MFKKRIFPAILMALLISLWPVTQTAKAAPGVGVFATEITQLANKLQLLLS